MALPSRKSQIVAVSKFLEDPANEERTVDQVAELIVDGYHDLLLKDIKQASPPLRVGLAFKTPFHSAVHHVAWVGGGRVWIITAASRHGWLGPIDAPMWRYVEESKAKTGAPGNNPKWSAGDKVSAFQRSYQYEILAAGDKCVLLRGLKGVPVGTLQAESGEAMDKYYVKEVEGW